VDTLAFGAYRREVFERIGFFDEELVRNQDDEFNFRLIQNGGKIWLDASIQTRYYSRSTLVSLWRQYYGYGFYKVRVIAKRHAVAAWRHLAPAGFIASLAAGALLAWARKDPRWILAVAIPYFTGNLIASIVASRSLWKALLFVPPSFLTLHLAYGLGFWHGVVEWAVRSAGLRSSGRDSQHR
jgi:GT2 family glycosyltransferase